MFLNTTLHGCTLLYSHPLPSSRRGFSWEISPYKATTCFSAFTATSLSEWPNWSIPRFYNQAFCIYQAQPFLVNHDSQCRKNLKKDIVIFEGDKPNSRLASNNIFWSFFFRNFWQIYWLHPLKAITLFNCRPQADHFIGDRRREKGEIAWCRPLPSFSSRYTSALSTLIRFTNTRAYDQLWWTRW